MNQIDLKSRHAIITGGARGIGYAAAERLLASGAHVALWDLDADKLATSVAALQAAHPHQQVSGHALDISDDASVQREANALAARALPGAIPVNPKNALRTYGIGAQILRDLKVTKMRLLSKPRRMPSMAGFDLQVTGYLQPEDEPL
jgi:3-oxoacyl-[acyl-carrier protein] reductase